jgi:hypothetical protein
MTGGVLSSGSDEGLLLVQSDDSQTLYRLVDKVRAHRGVRMVRGDQMRTWGALYSEMSSAFQFFVGWGWNLDALHECLSDPELRFPRHSRMCVITAAEQVLADESDGELERFIRCLVDVSADADDISAGSSGLRRQGFATVVVPYDLPGFPISTWFWAPGAMKQLDASDESATLSYISDRLRSD